MKWNSFRVRLSLWNIGVLAVALVGFGIAEGYSVQAGVAAAIDRELVGRAHPFAISHFSPAREGAVPQGLSHRGEVRPPRRSRVRPEADIPGRDGWAVVDARLAALNEEAARLVFLQRPRVLGRDGRGLGRFPGDTPWDERTFRLSLAGQTRYSTTDAFQAPIRVLSVPLMDGDEVAGVVQVAHDVSALERLRAGLVRKLLVLVPLALLAAGAGGLFLTGRALRPIREVTLAAAEISSQDLSRRLAVTGHDELAELAATFNDMLGRLEAAFDRLALACEQLRRFTADVSHELRTPLTRLKGSLSLARVETASEPDFRRTLDMAEEAADVMHRLVLDLLHLARSDSGQLRPVLRPADLHEILADAITGAGDPNRVRVELEVPPGPLRLWGDAFHLTRLFSNLVENAVRHTPPGDTVRVTARAEGGEITVRVRDTGEGIAPEHLPHLFERFYRADAARDRARGGTGLGLPIALSIAEAHEGSISIDSRVGEGTEVCVRLPREPGVRRSAFGVRRSESSSSSCSSSNCRVSIGAESSALFTDH